MSEVSPHVTLALAAIQSYITRGLVISIPEDISEELLNNCAGAFVCLKMNGDLRGCIGTIEPARECLAEEIISNAISAAVSDPRFLPVESHEISVLECSVDVLCPAEEIECLTQLDPKRYGVIVECEMKRGLLLPDLEGVDTPEVQIDIARRKAFIKPTDPFKLYRFEVKRYK